MYAQVVHGNGNDPKAEAAAPIYEYWWTIGHAGAAEHRDRWGGLLETSSREDQIWDQLADPAAYVYLYFPTWGGWRIKEAAATLKYLTPVPEQHSWWREVAAGLSAIEPLVGDAASIASPIVGGTASKVLNAVAKLQAVSVPQVKDVAWSAGKVTFRPEREGAGVMQGVIWKLPPAVFHLLGGRLTGSLALSVIPARQQKPSGTEANLRPLSALAHAVIRPKDGNPIWLPGPTARSFLDLELKPRQPSQAQAAGNPPAGESPKV